MILPAKESLNKDLGALNFEIVRRVAEKASLKEICLIDAEVKSDLVRRNYRQANLEINFHTDTKPLSEEEFITLCHFELAASDQEQSNDFFLEIKATYSVAYKIDSPDPLPFEDLDMFGRINPLYNVWPYWREFVQNMTVRLGLPALTLPLFKIPAPSVPKKAQASKRRKKNSEKPQAS